MIEELHISPPIYVVGATGFLGSVLVRLLRSQGRSVIAVGRRQSENIDLRVSEYFDLEIEPGSDIVHLAEPNSVSQAEKRGQEYQENCEKICQALLNQPWRRFFYASSAVVYGDMGQELSSITTLTVQDPGAYQKSKLACEQIVVKKNGIVGRFSNLIGFGMSLDNVVSSILSQIDKMDTLRLWNGSPIRDFLWVEDAAHGIIAALDAVEKVDGSILNFGTGRGTSIENLVDIVLCAANIPDRKVIWKEKRKFHSFLVLNIEKTTSLLSWMPLTQLEDAVTQLLALGNIKCPEE
ncbi:MAG: NAD(P)-dependent oxidoreductase [Sneathiella sp.]|nr:NAD(P)-dependent oxidoreductase [Sneathiella sp.]